MDFNLVQYSCFDGVDARKIAAINNRNFRVQTKQKNEHLSKELSEASELKSQVYV